MNTLLRTLFFVTVFTLTTSAHAQFGKEWLLCNTDADCLKVNGICGRKDSINKKFTKDFDLFTQKMAAVSSCSQLSDKEKAHNANAEAKCITNQCKLQEPPATAPTPSDKK
ncbi:MAG: hypothetical protein IT287_05425 [Bdellovibrionaceae bacterium]|nr:hypothetical protein [Pseudobdellovibrionaceae bacterium]